MGIKTAATEQNDSMDGAFEPRLEDYRLLTGAGNFQDDEATAGAAWGVFVRSPHAFADIRGIDTASAQAAPGVLAVLTAAALDATGIGSVSVPVPVPGSPGMVSPHRPSLARASVRHVGDPVALVVAGSEAEARDAAEDRPEQCPKNGIFTHRLASLPKTKFAADSALEESGFEPSVPPAKVNSGAAGRRGQSYH